jgi:hypothetical protein
LEPFKIILFILAFVALLVIGRLLAASSEVHASQLPASQPLPGGEAAEPSDHDAPARRHQVVGSEIAFPIQIAPVRELEDGTYNRPNILNYYFAKTDLLRGPEDPDCLFDELRIEAQDPGNKYPLIYQYTVATLAGLRQVMEREKLSSLYLGGNPLVIVPRWDLSLIIQTVMDEIMRGYSAEQRGIEDEEPAAQEEDA